MKLYIKQKVFSWNDKFTVRNEFNEDVYFVEGEVFSLGKKLHVFDGSGAEVAYIEQKVFSFRPRYYIHIAGQVYEMVKELTFFRPSYSIVGLPWKLEGNFMAHEYSLEAPNGTLMRVYKEWFTWGDSYVMDFGDAQNALLYLCGLLVVDCVLDSERSSS